MLAPWGMRTLLVAVASFFRFLVLIGTGRLHQPRARLGLEVDAPRENHFVAFRETRVAAHGDTVLLIWFELRFVAPKNRRRASLFRRVCIITTPFFSGVDGFVSKLWMEDRVAARYLGIYEFASASAASEYASYIAAVLHPLSKPGSISWEIVEQESVADTIATHAPARAA